MTGGRGPRWQPETFMARLPEPVGAELLGAARKRSVAAGYPLLMQGGDSREVYVLSSADRGSSACAKITASLVDGDESLFGIRVSGDVVGEIAAIRGSVRTATVTACNALHLYVMEESRFLRFLDQHPVAWKALACVLADRLDAANRRRLDSGAFKQVEIRLARALVELTERMGRARANGQDLGVDLTQAELGRLIAAQEDTIGKAVRILKKENLVVTGYRGLVITDLDRLRAYARL